MIKSTLRLLLFSTTSFSEIPQSVEIINSVGNPFDPNLHEAIEYTENSDIDDNVVISEIQSVYKIHGQVLRPSKVNVCKNKSVSSGVDINE